MDDLNHLIVWKVDLKQYVEEEKKEAFLNQRDKPTKLTMKQRLYIWYNRLKRKFNNVVRYIRN